MSHDQVLTEALALDVDQRVLLANAIWQSVQRETAESPLTAEQMRELDRRLDDLRENPDDGEPWETVKQSLLDELRAGK